MSENALFPCEDQKTTLGAHRSCSLATSVASALIVYAACAHRVEMVENAATVLGNGLKTKYKKGDNLILLF